MKKFALMFLIFLFAALHFSPGLQKNAALAADRVQIAMGYIPNVQFAPFYVAIERGYFQDENLEVTFDYGLATDIMALAAQGLIDFGISDGDQVIIAREKGVPVKAVYAMYVKYPVGIASFAEKGIRKVQDLAGKRIGIPGPYGSNYIGLQVILGSAGMSLDDIIVESIGYTQVESLIAGRVDAAAVFINNEPIVLREAGKEVNLIKAYEITPMVSAAVITSDSLIKTNPALVKRFIRAVRRAGDFALEKRERVMPLLRKYIPTLTDENMAINTKVLLASLELWRDEDNEKSGLGYTTEGDWQKSIDTLYNLGLIKKKMRPAECYTNAFLGK